MKNIYCIMGLPGSGKTTYANYLSKIKNITVIHKDNYSKQDAFILLNNELTHNDVIYDALLFNIKQRKELLSNLGTCKKYLIIMDTPLEECLQRNSQRIGCNRLPDSAIYNLHKKFEPPSYDEGWDEIYYCYEKESELL